MKKKRLKNKKSNRKKKAKKWRDGVSAKAEIKKRWDDKIDQGLKPTKRQGFNSRFGKPLKL